MRAFLKILFLVLVALIAVKLLPLTIGLGFVVGFGLAFLVAIASSLLAGAGVLALFLGIILSPLWIPVALVVGMIALVRRTSGKRGVVA